MKSHELARMLLNLPDLEMVVVQPESPEEGNMKHQEHEFTEPWQYKGKIRVQIYKGEVFKTDEF